MGKSHSEADNRSADEEVPHHLIKPNVSLLCSQEPTTGLYPALHKCSLYNQSLLFIFTLSPKWPVCSGILTTIMYPFLISPIHAPCPAHLCFDHPSNTRVFKTDWDLSVIQAER
jgi:hypothetical protein